MKTDTKKNVFPPFLTDYGSFLSHLSSELQDRDKGHLFEDFARKLIPHSDVGGRFTRPVGTPASHDKGIDFTCEGKESYERLIIQVKFLIRDVKSINAILSDFMAYEDSVRHDSNEPVQLTFIDTPGLPSTIPALHFMIFTAASIKSGIMPKFEKEKPPVTYRFYHELEAGGRIHIIDGPDVFALLQQAYRKEHFLPSNLTLRSVKPFIEMGNVYVGVVKGRDFKELYDAFGNALFLENIREYLGPKGGRVKSDQEKTVNEKIVETLDENPDKFLARNNGVTFRATSVQRADECTLHLGEASIVNGCQTTMSLVQRPSDQSHVLVKVVQTDDAWDIAEAANFQNEIKRIHLSMARYIRPAAIKSAASKSHMRFVSSSEDASAFAILDTIYQNEITQEEVSSLFIGLFSRTPNNVVYTDYTALRTDIINRLYQEDSNLENTLGVLLKLHLILQEAAERVQQNLSPELQELFQRFWKERTISYRAFLAVLAACGCVGENPYEKGYRLTYEDMQKFLQRLEHVIEEQPQHFMKYYQNAFTAVAIDVIKPGEERIEILKNMTTYIERAKFHTLFYKMNVL